MKPTALFTSGLMLLVALGCSNNEPANEAAAPAPPQAAAAAPPTAAAPAPTAAAPAPAAAEAPSPAAPQARPGAPPPIATAEGPFDGVRVEVTELKRTSGGTLTLKFAIVNDSTRQLGHSEVGLGSGGLMQTAYAIDGVHLIDPVGKKKYFVAKDSAGACVCSQFGFVDGGSRANHWAKFSAPPDNVELISIVIPSFAPMDDVPLSR